MSFERSLRKYVVEALAPLDACAVENSACPGFPDVEFVGGAIELKVLNGWPVRATTVVRLPKFRPVQRNWLRARWKKGGLALLLLRVDREHLIFDGEYAADFLGRVTREELFRYALWHWPPGAMSRDALLGFIVDQFSFKRYTVWSIPTSAETPC